MTCIYNLTEEETKVYNDLKEVIDELFRFTDQVKIIPDIIKTLGEVNFQEMHDGYVTMDTRNLLKVQVERLLRSIGETTI